MNQRQSERRDNRCLGWLELKSTAVATQADQRNPTLWQPSPQRCCGRSIGRAAAGWTWLGMLSASLVIAATGNPLAAQETRQDPVELDEAARAAAERLEQVLPPDSEARAMLDAIRQGRGMGPNDGWFRLATPQSAYAWDQMLATYDRDGDGWLARDEFPGAQRWFQRLDRNSDGVLSDEDHRWNLESASGSVARLLRQADKDDNGLITRAELEQAREALLGTEQDAWSIDELRQILAPPPRVTATDSQMEWPTASQLMLGLERQEIGAHLPGPNVGDIAPDFTLKTLDGTPVTLATWCQEKPVVLIFGNFTCGPFRAQAGNLERLFDRYQNQFHFLVVYVREAHPSDGWAMRSNESAEIVLPQPTKYPERSAVAQRCQQLMSNKLPLVVDEMDDPVGRQYSGMPSRLYLLDGDRQVLFKSGRGPHFFSPTELEEALLWHLAETQSVDNRP